MSTKVSAINPVANKPAPKINIFVEIRDDNQLVTIIERESNVFKVTSSYRESADAIIFCNTMEIVNEIISLPMDKVLAKYKK